jgi:translocation and assembly module TamA
MRLSLYFTVGLLAVSTARAELIVEGLGEDLERNVRSFATISNEACDAPDWRIRRRFRALEGQVQSALEAFGYYSPDVTSELRSAEACWQAVVTVDAGPQVLFRNIDISVTGDVTEDPIYQASERPEALREGQPLIHSVYDNFRDAIQIAAAERGYVEARFITNTLRVYPEDMSADVILHFESGPRYRFGEVTIEQDFMYSDVIARSIDIEFDAPYDAQVLTDAYKDLSNSGYFSNIQIVPEYDLAADRRVPITIRLQPGTRIEYNFGVGFATDTGLRLSASARNRRLSGEGRRLDTSLSLSEVRSGIFVEYRTPLDDPRVEWQSYTGSLETESTDTSDSDLYRVGIRRSRRFAENWLRTYSLDLDYEEFTVGTVDDDSLLVLPAIAVDHKDSDRDINPRRGRRLRFELRGTDTFLGSSTRFVQVIGNGRFILPAGERGRIISRVSAGFTGKDEFDELPPSVRFFAGGDASVRGFGYQTLGPKDEDGNVIGGSHLLVGSLEYEHHLRGNFYGAAFLDGGNAFDGTDIDAAWGTGLGIKWRSPLGPFSLYVAHPLNKSDDDVRIHVSLGADL